MKTIRLDHGKANTLDMQMLQHLDRELRGAEAEDSVMITASGTIFSAGVDLFRLLDGGPAYVRDFLPLLTSVLMRIYDFPRPVVAAINGHAVAGGCLIACACDIRIMASGSGRIGLTELLVGVPFPSVPLEIVRSVMPQHVLRRIIYEGGTYLPEEALRIGLIDEIARPDALMSRATELAVKLASIPREVFTLTKRRLRPDLSEVLKHHADDENEILRIWTDPKTHEHIRGYIQSTFGGKS
jgi:enoyl-CoA hydratase/carnithine racemase